MKARIGGRLAGGEADLFEALVLAEDPAHGLVCRLRVGHVALLAILLHAEHTVVVADRSREDVNPSTASCHPIRDGLLGRNLGGWIGGGGMVEHRWDLRMAQARTGNHLDNRGATKPKADAA
jgi:hypothetical protein